jgi:hypothetical protein
VPGSQEALQEAVSELHQYLSDQKAPLMVADSIGLLLRYPPDFLAAQIEAWISGQNLAAPVADYLFHGAKKIWLMGEFDLVPRTHLAKYLRELAEELVLFCPEGDRPLLKQNLDRLGQTLPAGPSAGGVLHRQTGEESARPPASGGGSESLQQRRMGLLLEHLRPLASAPPEQRTELASQFMTAAAVEASSVNELEQHLAPLKQLGIDTRMEQVFRTLAQSLAGWVLQPVGGAPAGIAHEQLEAMQRIVSLTRDPEEAAKRFREMVHAAIEQFNEGQLGRAVTMFELAERLAKEEKVKSTFVDPVRKQGHEYLNEDRLAKFAERTDYRQQLRTVLNFFTTLQPEGLLKSLDGEANRERRRTLLALLEVHEQAARQAAWELLVPSVEDGAQVDPFFQMNLVYLLRVIPRPEQASVEDEVNVVMRVSGRTSPPPVVKQVIAYLSHVRHEKAERALITYLKVFESMLLQPETAVYPTDELEVLLDRTCGALARYGTPRAWRLLIDHGLKNDPRLGAPYARLAEAGHLDLSGSRDMVGRMIAALRAELPRSGLMGLVATKNEDKAVALIQGISGTPLPEVRDVLQEVARNHPNTPLSEAASKGLTALAGVGKPPPPPTLSGDLELFGLPNLLQTIGQSQLSGVLSVMNADGQPRATLLFETGQFRGGEAGSVKGSEAVYELLERPFPGTFAFVSRADVASRDGAANPEDLFPLLMEGMRRYDEFKQAAALVPDKTKLKPTGKPHTSVEGENGDVPGLLWKQVAAGKTAEECEASLAVDAYRVRRLLAHWVEEGALQALAA